MPANWAGGLFWFVLVLFLAVLAVGIAVFILAMLRLHFFLLRPEEPRTIAHCTGCGVDLVSNPNATYNECENGHTVFVCPCGTGSSWDFDAPAPVHISSWQVFRRDFSVTARATKH